MPTTSRAVRKLRRAKREKSLAFRLLSRVVVERDQARQVAVALDAELKKHRKAEVASEQDTCVHCDGRGYVDQGEGCVSVTCEECRGGNE